MRITYKKDRRINYLSILLFILLVNACTGQQQRPPNVIVLIADDAGYADFGFMGSQDMQTPNLDQLAGTGVVFTDAHTSASVCSPSRAGLLTGRYQQRFGHQHNSPPEGMGMDINEITLGQALKEKGYKTALVGKWHVGDEGYNHPNERGFDEFYGFIGGHRSYFPDDPTKPRGNKSMQRNGKYVDFEGYLTDDLGEKAISFIDQNKDQPFFIYLSYSAVHTPMQATEEDLARFEGHPRQKLAAMTWAMDRSIGNVLKKLEEEGLRENTLVFFMSDNGGPTRSNTASNYPLKSTKGLEFEGGHRVPFIFSWTGVFNGGSTFEGLTSTLDIFKTVTNAANIQWKGNRLDGVDLLPYMTGEKQGDPHEMLYWQFHPWAAVRSGDHKVVVAGDVGSALYDLEKDISEMNDLKEENPADYEALIQALGNWREEIPPPKWYGEGRWEEVKAHMYGELLENREPKVFNPGQLDRLKAGE